MLYNFCPKCGGKLREENKALYICTKCNYFFHINPAPTAVAIIVNKKGEVLLVRRAFDPSKGKWDIPGGFVDLNESLEEALERELKEELDLTINNFIYSNSYPHRYLYKGVNEYLIGITFIVKLKDEPMISPRDDINEARFFSLDKIPWNNLAFPSVKLSLEDYISRRQHI